MSDSTEPRLVRVAGKAHWHVYYERRRYSTGCTNRAEAQKALEAWVEQNRRNAQLAAGQTVSALLDAYLSIRQREITKNGADRVGYAHKALNAYFGDWAIERLNKRACLDYRDQRLQTVVLRTVRTELEALRAALKWGMTDEAGRIVERMPDLALPPKGEGRVRWLRRTEADSLLAACRQRHLRLFVEIGLHTGARSGAILSLIWDRVDLDERAIELRLPGVAQTKKRRVAQAINGELHAILTMAKANATSKYVIERAGGDVRSIKHGFASACERAGLGADVTPHTLRHTAITWMLQAGVPIWEVSAFAGMTVKMIEDTYGHATVANKRRAAKALERPAP